MGEIGGGQQAFVWFYAILGSVYGIWMLYAGGISHLLISALLYAPGTILYARARRELGGQTFPKLADKATLAVLLAMAAASVVLFVRGDIVI